MSALCASRFSKFMTVSALTFAMASSFMASISFAANPTEYVDYPKLLQEQRAWAGLTSRNIHVGDISWSYSEGGSKDKPTLLLIHGIDTNRDAWNDVAHILTQHYHVIIPDLPGSGNTKVSADFDFSIPNLSQQLRYFVETTHIQNNLHVAGHSLGGSIALYYASHFPEDTKSLFLIDVGGLFKSSGTQYLKNPIFLKQLLVTQPGDFNYAMKKAMVNQPFIPEVRRKLQEQLLIAKSEESAKLINELYNFNQRNSIASYKALLQKIESPTLILWGKQDQIVNVEVANELKASIKHAQTPIILNNVGHMPILEAPENVSQNYMQFLDKVQTRNTITYKH